MALTEHHQLDGSVYYETSDGNVFTDRDRAEVQQAALDQTLTHVAVVGTPQIVWEGGEGFVEGASPFGVALLRYDRLSNRQVWSVSPDTLESLRALPPSVRVAKTRELKREREEGSVMVEGIVRQNARRPAPNRERPVTLQPLIDRAQALVITIANIDSPTEGQVAEISRSVSALQAERDRIAAELDEMDGHLSIGRAVVLAYSDPRAARAQTG